MQAAFWIEYPDERAWMARNAERRARKESFGYPSRPSFLSRMAGKAKKAARNEADGLEWGQSGFYYETELMVMEGMWAYHRHKAARYSGAAHAAATDYHHTLGRHLLQAPPDIMHHVHEILDSSKDERLMRLKKERAWKRQTAVDFASIAEATADAAATATAAVAAAAAADVALDVANDAALEAIHNTITPATPFLRSHGLPRRSLRHSTPLFFPRRRRQRTFFR